MSVTPQFPPVTTFATTADNTCTEEVDVVAWHAVGYRLAFALKHVEGVEQNVNVEAWHDVGSHLLNRLASLSNDDEEAEQGINVDAWHDAGSRLLNRLANLSDDDDEEATQGINVDAWHNVGSRLLNRLANLSYDEEGCIDDDLFKDHVCTDTESTTDGHTMTNDDSDAEVEPKININAWHTVGSRLARTIARVGNEKK